MSDRQKLRADPLWKDLLQIQWPATPYNQLKPSRSEREELSEVIQTFSDWLLPEELPLGEQWFGTPVEHCYNERDRLRKLLQVEIDRVRERDTGKQGG